jgi:hypothetical protein
MSLFLAQLKQARHDYEINFPKHIEVFATTSKFIGVNR